MATPLPAEKPLLDLHGAGGEAVVKILAHERYINPALSRPVLMLLYRQPLERRTFPNKGLLIAARTAALKVVQQQGAGEEAVKAYIGAQRAVQKGCAVATSVAASMEGIYAFPKQHFAVHRCWQQAQKRARTAEKAAKKALREADAKVVLPAAKRSKRGKALLRCTAPLDCSSPACLAWCAKNCNDAGFMRVPGDDVLNSRDALCTCDAGECQCPFATWGHFGNSSDVSRKLRSQQSHCMSMTSRSGGLKPMIDRNFLCHDLARALAKNARMRQAEFLRRAILESDGAAGELAQVGIHTDSDRICELWAIDEALERAILLGLSGENISLPHLAALLNDPDQFWDRFVNTWRKNESDVVFALQTIFQVASQSIDGKKMAELHISWKASYDEAKRVERAATAVKMAHAARNAAARRSRLEKQHELKQSKALSAAVL